MPVARNLSFKGKMPQIKALWNRHSATFQQHTPLNDGDANTKNNTENPPRLKNNSTTNAAPKMPRSPMRRPSPTSVTTSHHNQQDTHNATAKKRPRTLRIHPNRDGTTHFGPGSAITTPEGATDTTDNNNKIVFLRRDDLQLGPIIGEGGFAQVYGLFQCPSKLKCAELKGKAEKVIETTKNNRDSATSGKENGKENSKLNDSVCSHQSTASSVAKELEDNRQYCVKVIRKGLLQNNTLFQKAADDLVNEAELLAQLGDHPHIIKLRGLPLSGMAATASSSTKRPLCHPKKYHHFFLLLDQLSETLGDRIEMWKHNDDIQPKQQQPQQQVGAGPGLQRPSLVRTKSVAAQFLDIKVSYATQMASALSYLHQRRILFRDLKPENIGFRGTLATGDHTLVMFDFGMARHLPSSSQNNNNTPGGNSVAAHAATKRGHERSHSAGSSSAWMMQAFSGVTASSSSSPTTVATSISSFAGFGGGGGSSSRPPKPGDCSASVSSNHSSQSGASSAAGSASSNKSNLENKSPLGKQFRQALPEQRQWPLPQPPPRKEEDEFFRMTVCGTQRYMSNEVLLEGKYSFKSDCYAWAMVVWEIFAHAKPFHYMSPTVHKILVAKQGDRPPLSCYGIAEELQELMELAWAPKVADRVTMAEICSRLTKYNQANPTFAAANTSFSTEEPSFSSSLPPSPEKQPRQAPPEQLQQVALPETQGSPQKTLHDSSLFSAPRSKGHRKSSSMNLPTAASLLDGDDLFGFNKEASSSGQNRNNLIPAMGNRSHRQPRQNLPPQQHQPPPAAAPPPRLMRRLIPKMVLRERKDVAAPATVEAPPSTLTAPPATPPTVPPVPPAAQPGRIQVQQSGSLSFDQQSDNDGSFNNINASTPGRACAAPTVNKGLSLQELQERKRDLKEQLKQYDIRFAQHHGRMPRKDEKEPIRAVYEHYNALKLHIVHLEKLKRQLKAYDMHFASQHGRMPYKAEKEAIRHLYEQYKTLKVTIGTFVDNFDASRGNNTSISSLPGGVQTPPRSVFSQWAMGGWSGAGYGSFDSELTPEGIEVAEL